MSSFEKVVVTPEHLVNWLRGGDVPEPPLVNLVKENAELVARCLTYVLKSGVYHRERFITTLLTLFCYGSSVYRDVAYGILLETPFEKEVFL